MARKETQVAIDREGKGLTLPEIGTGGFEVDHIDGFDFKAVADYSAFMNEKVTIMVYEDNQEGALRIVAPSVNGVTQPIVRGKRQEIKRKYLEVLARSVITKYDQRRQDPFNPSSLLMVGVTRQTFPFSIVRDPSEYGPDWLEYIMAQAMIC